MKIENSLGPLAGNIKKSGEQPARPEVPEVKREETGAAGDVVQLSERARLAARATELARGAPDLRQDKIEALKTRIQAGTYNVDGRTTAEALIRKSITEV